MELLERLKDAQKTAMKQKDKARLGTLRLVMAAIKQQEVDTRQSLSDEAILAVLTKNVKQRRDSVAQYQAAGRDDLAETELAEIAVIEEFLPQPLSDDEVDALVKAAVEKAGASSMQDMGKVMGVLKPQVQGCADMGKVSQRVKAHLG
ncbi:glutamyl-tRNA amidotransferase [Salinivibrio kushneri]|uniref:Glutamyl-tRNA amidotransferase n=1 Tax=Salinivibrio kushneri TaxID=1908198 RepID=A0AB36JYK3_9GAMM|nr:GatB/YqeY domain-containing protein [Salinivibrio kushneri]OOE40271.1 glutamyl-tRNA amidotransferase [Salinivibrio kushneri]QCP01236.1 GatB/YqeY domain-containing protein [Salinivibrio kushneri]